MSSNFIRIFFKKNTDLKQVETELSNNLDSNLVLEIDDSIIIDKKIIDFLNLYSKKSKKSFLQRLIVALTNGLFSSNFKKPIGPMS